MSDDLIEKIARAIHETDSTTTTTWEELCDLASRDGYMTAKLKRGICLTSARTALSAIENSGTYKVAPVTLTIEMIRAAEDAYGGGYVDQDMWTAMLSARPPLPET